MKLPLLAAAACGVAILSCLTAGGSQNTESRAIPARRILGPRCISCLTRGSSLTGRSGR